MPQGTAAGSERSGRLPRPALCFSERRRTAPDGQCSSRLRLLPARAMPCGRAVRLPQQPLPDYRASAAQPGRGLASRHRPGCRPPGRRDGEPRRPGTCSARGLGQSAGTPRIARPVLTPRPTSCPASCACRGESKAGSRRRRRGRRSRSRPGPRSVGALAVPELRAQEGQRLLAGPLPGQEPDCRGTPGRNRCAFAEGVQGRTPAAWSSVAAALPRRSATGPRPGPGAHRSAGRPRPSATQPLLTPQDPARPRSHCSSGGDSAPCPAASRVTGRPCRSRCRRYLGMRTVSTM
ncbi:hypothetical protein SUDANB135_00033 [Streptomyces sp. SudanB135_2055]